MSALQSDRATALAIAQHADEPFIALLTIAHPSLAAPYRFARNRKSVVSNGNTFTAAFFEIELPGDGSDAPQANLTVSNVNRKIGRSLERLPADDKTVCQVDLVLPSTPNTIERSWAQFILQNAVWDAMTVRGTIGRMQYFDEPWPSIRVTTRTFRGISPEG